MMTDVTQLTYAQGIEIEAVAEGSPVSLQPSAGVSSAAVEWYHVPAERWEGPYVGWVALPAKPPVRVVLPPGPADVDIACLSRAAGGHYYCVARRPVDTPGSPLIPLRHVVVTVAAIDETRLLTPSPSAAVPVTMSVPIFSAVAQGRRRYRWYLRRAIPSVDSATGLDALRARLLLIRQHLELSLDPVAAATAPWLRRGEAATRALALAFFGVDAFALALPVPDATPRVSWQQLAEAYGRCPAAGAAGAITSNACPLHEAYDELVQDFVPQGVRYARTAVRDGIWPSYKHVPDKDDGGDVTYYCEEYLNGGDETARRGVFRLHYLTPEMASLSSEPEGVGGGLALTRFFLPEARWYLDVLPGVEAPDSLDEAARDATALFNGGGGGCRRYPFGRQLTERPAFTAEQLRRLHAQGLTLVLARFQETTESTPDADDRAAPDAELGRAIHFRLGTPGAAAPAPAPPPAVLPVRAVLDRNLQANVIRELQWIRFVVPPPPPVIIGREVERRREDVDRARAALRRHWHLVASRARALQGNRGHAAAFARDLLMRYPGRSLEELLARRFATPQLMHRDYRVRRVGTDGDGEWIERVPGSRKRRVVPLAPLRCGEGFALLEQGGFTEDAQRWIIECHAAPSPSGGVDIFLDNRKRNERAWIELARHLPAKVLADPCGGEEEEEAESFMDFRKTLDSTARTDADGTFQPLASLLRKLKSKMPAAVATMESHVRYVNSIIRRVRCAVAKRNCRTGKLESTARERQEPAIEALPLPEVERTLARMLKESTALMEPPERDLLREFFRVPLPVTAEPATAPPVLDGETVDDLRRGDEDLVQVEDDDEEVELILPPPIPVAALPPPPPAAPHVMVVAPVPPAAAPPASVVAPSPPPPPTVIVPGGGAGLPPLGGAPAAALGGAGSSSGGGVIDVTRVKARPPMEQSLIDDFSAMQSLMQTNPIYSTTWNRLDGIGARLGGSVTLLDTERKTVLTNATLPGYSLAAWEKDLQRYDDAVAAVASILRELRSAIAQAKLVVARCSLVREPPSLDLALAQARDQLTKTKKTTCAVALQNSIDHCEKMRAAAGAAYVAVCNKAGELVDDADWQRAVNAYNGAMVVTAVDLCLNSLQDAIKEAQRCEAEARPPPPPRDHTEGDARGFRTPEHEAAEEMRNAFGEKTDVHYQRLNDGIKAQKAALSKRYPKVENLRGGRERVYVNDKFWEDVERVEWFQLVHDDDLLVAQVALLTRDQPRLEELRTTRHDKLVVDAKAEDDVDMSSYDAAWARVDAMRTSVLGTAFHSAVAWRDRRADYTARLPGLLDQLRDEGDKLRQNIEDARRKKAAAAAAPVTPMPAPGAVAPAPVLPPPTTVAPSPTPPPAAAVAPPSVTAPSILPPSAGAAVPFAAAAAVPDYSYDEALLDKSKSGALYWTLKPTSVLLINRLQQLKNDTQDVIAGVRADSPDNYRIYDVGGGGSCFFYTAQKVQGGLDEKTQAQADVKAKELRELIVAHVAKDRDQVLRKTTPWFLSILNGAYYFNSRARRAPADVASHPAWQLGQNIVAASRRLVGVGGQTSSQFSFWDVRPSAVNEEDAFDAGTLWLTFAASLSTDEEFLDLLRAPRAEKERIEDEDERRYVRNLPDYDEFNDPWSQLIEPSITSFEETARHTWSAAVSRFKEAIHQAYLDRYKLPGAYAIGEEFAAATHVLDAELIIYKIESGNVFMPCDTTQGRRDHRHELIWNLDTTHVQLIVWQRSAGRLQHVFPTFADLPPLAAVDYLKTCLYSAIAGGATEAKFQGWITEYAADPVDSHIKQGMFVRMRMELDAILAGKPIFADRHLPTPTEIDVHLKSIGRLARDEFLAIDPNPRISAPHPEVVPAPPSASAATTPTTAPAPIIVPAAKPAPPPPLSTTPAPAAKPAPPPPSPAAAPPPRKPAPTKAPVESEREALQTLVDNARPKLAPNVAKTILSDVQAATTLEKLTELHRTLEREIDLADIELDLLDALDIVPKKKP